ncbi:sensor histidine kinase [Rubrivivax sp. A210]|uniref:sensor histidine kinase n=1 Tax=Rubrivivax sp. A210 TaxID=2772301 RepID=UPI0019181F14|nr:PAS domain-containing sensor histidine kinase [Rubrivivax sp. A210]
MTDADQHKPLAAAPAAAAAAPPVPLAWGPLLEEHPLPHLVYEWGSLRLLAANAAALQRYGCGRAELLALSRPELLLPEEVPALHALLADVAAGRLPPQPRVWRERARDGRLLHADVRGMQVLFKGRLARLVVVVDAGAKAQLAADTELSRQRHEALLAAIPDLWLVIDDEGRYAEVSDPGHPALSAPWPEKLGRRLIDALEPDLARLIAGKIALAHRSGQPQSHHYELKVRDGQVRAFEARYVALDGGRTMMLVRDVTENVQLGRRFQDMAEAAPLGIFMTDADGACSYANPEWQRIYGLTLEQSLGAGWVAQLHPEDRQTVQQQWLAAAAATATFEQEFRILAADQVRRVAVRSSPIRRADGTVSGHVGTVVDVTQVREIEAARQAQAVAEEAGRRQAGFMSRVSHELRTPLNAVLGFGELLQHDGTLAGTHALEHIGYIVQAGRHMLALVDDLLELQRLEQGSLRPQLAPLDLGRHLAACAELLAPAALEAGVSLLVEAPATLTLQTDARCLRQILLNLASNAVKYAGRGARVVVRVERDGDRVRIAVEDNGRGMTAAQLQRLFHPFERLGQENSGLPGSGLGLVITRQLAHMLGGEVSLASQPGAGTVATLELPLAGAA